MDSVDYYIMLFSMCIVFGGGFLFWITKTKSGRKWLKNL